MFNEGENGNYRPTIRKISVGVHHFSRLSIALFYGKKILNSGETLHTFQFSQLCMVMRHAEMHRQARHTKRRTCGGCSASYVHGQQKLTVTLVMNGCGSDGHGHAILLIHVMANATNTQRQLSSPTTNNEQK